MLPFILEPTHEGHKKCPQEVNMDWGETISL